MTRRRVVTRRRLRAFAARGRDEGGSILPLTALILAVLLAVGAVAVDTGRLATSSRDLQGVTDRAALDALLDLRDAVYPKASAEAGANASLGRNPGMAGSGMASAWVVHEAQPGRFADDGSFIADDFARDGVRVIVDSSVDSMFLPGTSDLRREAIARQDAIAAVAAGTAAARIEAYDPDGSNIGLITLLSALLGVEAGLDLVSWHGVAATDVRLGALAAELDVGTVDALLDTRLGVDRLVDAMVGAVVRDGPTAAVALQQLSMVLPPLPEIRLGDLLDVAAGDPALDVNVNALDLFMAAVQVANVDNAVAIDLGHSQIASVQLRIIEPPVIAVGRAEKGPDDAWVARARTAQLVLDLEVPILGILDIDIRPLARVKVLDEHLRLQVEVASGEVAIAETSCRAPGHITVEAVSSAATVTLGKVEIIEVEALGGLLLPTVGVSIATGPVSALAASEERKLLRPFVPETIAADEVGIAGLVRSNIELTSRPVNLGYLLNPVLNAVREALGPVLAPLDTVIADLLGILGVQAGVMDVWGVDLDCSGRYLVR